MPYPQDLIGRFLEYRIDPGGAAGTGVMIPVNRILSDQTAAANLVVYNGLPAAHPPGFFQIMPAGLPAWNFTFLKYIAGAITIAPWGGNLLTGPMTGCYLCKYTQAGATFLAHIGTANDTNSPESIEVKTAWLAFLGKPAVTNVSGIAPDDAYSRDEFAQHMQAGVAPAVCGYFNGVTAYSLMFAPIRADRNSRHQPMVKVVALKQMQMQPWSAIAALRTFRV